MTAKVPEIGFFVAILTYLGYLHLIIIGHLRDFFATITGYSRYKGEVARKGYADLSKSWESFFTRRLYHRMQDCWNRPICSNPGARFTIMERDTKDSKASLHLTGKTARCINLGSYNYLGFADDWKITCKPHVMKALKKWPISMTSSRMNAGNLSLHRELEERMARYIGKEDCCVFTMGYGTNSTTIPTLMGQGSLIISDSLNHTSIVNGSRGAPANIRVFLHNDPSSLESVLKEAVTKGQPKHHRPWTKIMVIVEGIYSMEGAICRLPEIVKICKRYKAYIYVDEAHSIGALGATGRGICEHTGVNPADIDVLMGTFTKSFSGMGGYIAANKDIVDHIRANAAGLMYYNSMSPVVAQQINTALTVIMGEDGTNIGRNKIQALKDNSNYFRAAMNRMGLHVYGDEDSPIVPVMIYMPGKVGAFSIECLKRGLAVVVVGFPATSVALSRARFCLSAGHTREDLDEAIGILDEVTSLVGLRYCKSPLGWPWW